MAWDKQLPGTFSSTALEFASHPLDEDRAFAWLIDLRTRNVGLKDVKQQVEDYIKLKNATAAHIDRQLKEVERFMKPWLLD